MAGTDAVCGRGPECRGQGIRLGGGWGWGGGRELRLKVGSLTTQPCRQYPNVTSRGCGQMGLMLHDTHRRTRRRSRRYSRAVCPIELDMCAHA